MPDRSDPSNSFLVKTYIRGWTSLLPTCFCCGLYPGISADCLNASWPGITGLGSPDCLPGCRIWLVCCLCWLSDWLADSCPAESDCGNPDWVPVCWLDCDLCCCCSRTWCCCCCSMILCCCCCTISYQTIFYIEYHKNPKCLDTQKLL